MSTINEFPNELLVEVFKRYILLPNQLNFHGDVRFILAAVCATWRETVFRQCSFWTTIAINERSVIPRSLKLPTIDPADIFLRTKTALNNARGLPLDLVIEIPDIDHPLSWFTVEHTDLLSKILQAETKHIASISISGDNWAMHISALRGFLNQPMPLLHSFNHTIWNFIDVWQHSTFEELIDTPDSDLIPILQYPFHSNPDLTTVNKWGRELYPNLRHLKISGAPYNWNLIPTRGLKSLQLCNQPADMEANYSIVRKLTSFAADTLEELNISNFFSSSHFHDATKEFAVLPALKTLALAYHHPDHVTHFLRHIRTPALRRLVLADTLTSTLSGGECEDLPSTDAMFAAMIRYLPLHQLESLKLDRIAFEDDLDVPRREDMMHEGKVSLKDIPLSLRFLEELASLKHLDVRVADDYPILLLLNFPLASRPSFSKGGKALHAGATMSPRRHRVALPSLETLRVHGREKQIHEFLKERVHYIFREKPLNVVISFAGSRKPDAKRIATMRSLTARLASSSDI